MTVYIVDHLMYKKFGPAKVVWKAERFFQGTTRWVLGLISSHFEYGKGEELWAQIADPSKWCTTQIHAVCSPLERCAEHPVGLLKLPCI